jgi:hypothetical protein
VINRTAKTRSGVFVSDCCAVDERDREKEGGKRKERKEVRREKK